MEHMINYFSDATPQEQEGFRKWMNTILREGVVSVTFIKTDGTERQMNCTLEEGVAIPHVKTTDREKEKSDEVCPVWDIDKKAWRSFRYDSICKINFEVSE